MPIILRTFERWFKQCDESNVNRFAGNLRSFGNGALSSTTSSTANRRRGVANFATHKPSTILQPSLTLWTEVAMRTLRPAAAALCLSAVAFVMPVPQMIGAAIAADPVGTWYTEDQESQVRITNCGGAICGSLVWLKEPNDPKTGKPKLDENNADPGKQNRPVLGIQIVLGMRPSGTPDKWDGSVYNAKDGKTYSGSFTMTGPNTAELKGCVLGGLICKSQTWSRAK